MDRQIVIDRAINIENLVSSLITIHYFPAKGLNIKFMHEVLYDPHCNFSLKINILRKCYPQTSNQLIEQLRRISNIRNIYAHCGLNITNIADPDKTGVMDPKDYNKPLEFEKLEKEFTDLAKEIEEQLFRILKETGLVIEQQYGQ